MRNMFENINNANIETVNQSQEKKDERVEKVVTANADYSIIYNIHDGIGKNKPLSPEYMDGKDGLVIEFAGLSRGFAQKQKADKIVSGIKDPDNVSSPMVMKAMEECKPIFFTDISMKTLKNNSDQENRILMMTLVESALGAGAVYAGFHSEKKNRRKDEGMTRRQFMKKAFALGAAAYLSGPILKELVPPDNSEKLRDIYKKIDAVHPELHSSIVEDRNLLIAQKTESVAKMLAKEKGAKPNLAVSIGAAHYDLPQALEMDEAKRLEELGECDSLSLKDDSLIVRINFSRIEGSDRRAFEVVLMNDDNLKNFKKQAG